MARFFGPGSSFATTSSGATGGGVASTFTLNQLTYMSPLPRDTVGTVGRQMQTRGLAYFLYVGYIPAGAVIDFAEVMISNAGPNANATLGEIGVVRSDHAPNTQTTVIFTTVAMSGTFAWSGTTPPVMGRNSVGFATTLVTAAHCWGVIRSTGIGTGFVSIHRSDDFLEGWARSATVNFRLTATTSFFGTVLQFPTTNGDGVCPDIRVRLVTGLP